MKKIIFLGLSLLAAVSFAGVSVGKIINLVPDEEGIKIILKTEDSKKLIASLYLSSTAANYLNTVENLESAKSVNQTIKITTKVNDNSEVQNVEFLK